MLIGLSGYAGSGKDTVGNYLVEKYGFERFAFADALKEMAYRLNPMVDIKRVHNGDPEEAKLQEIVDAIGWDEAKKHPEVRRILQVLGTECCRDIIGPNIWVSVLVRNLGAWDDRNIVITDVRFENEAEWVQSAGQLWWIHREGVEALNLHASENSVSEKDAFYTLFNRGDISDLHAVVDTVMKEIT